jgi:thiosulfate/3-mercaptopyruvate sulfurtransferase
MRYETIIDTTVLSQQYDDPDWVVVDCRYDLKDPGRCELDYGHAHVSGAVYAHLDRDLSGPAVAGRTGRHPLPLPETLVRTFSQWGIGPSTQVVAYDESTGAMTAARLWWLLKWAGHEAVAVLDGGFKKWCAEGLSYSTGAEAKKARVFKPAFRPHLAIDAIELLSVLKDPAWVVVDARSTDRYHGRGETVDAVAGHIAGAVSLPFASNLRDDGTFKSAAELSALYDTATGGRDAAHTAFYCGSGVTAAHDVLASAYAGRGMPRMYPGSWSEWITDPARPTQR